MKKLAFVLIVLGSGLAALGFSGWQLTTSHAFIGENDLWRISAGWPAWNQFQVTIGVMLLACGLMLRTDSKGK